MTTSLKASSQEGVKILEKQGNHESTHKIDLQKPKRREHKHNIMGNHKPQKEKERDKEEIQNQLENKQGLKWQ